MCSCSQVLQASCCQSALQPQDPGPSECCYLCPAGWQRMALQICYFVPGNLLNPTQSFDQCEPMLLSMLLAHVAPCCKLHAADSSAMLLAHMPVDACLTRLSVCLQWPESLSCLLCSKH